MKTTSTLHYLAVTACLLVMGANGRIWGQLSLSTTHSNVTCNGGSNGTATVIPTNGTGNYSYSWAPVGGTGMTVTGLAPGTYTVTVTDTVSSGGTEETLYTQGFEGAHGWTLNVSTGTNGADYNFWTVSDAEGGVTAGGCGIGGNGNKSLHITSVFNPTGGASYDAGGLCGILFCPETNMRAESPAFSTVGHTETTLEFDFISNGDALQDNASVWYNSGSGWNVLVPSIKSGVCGSGQGLWAHYSVALPTVCDNNATVKIAFNWTNNDDGVGTDPSVAINDVLITGLSAGTPVLDVQNATVTISEPAELTSVINQTSCGSYTLNGQTYSSSGTYQQTVQNGNGCDSTITLNLTINDLPTSGITQIDEITLLSVETGVTYQWINCGTGQPVPGATSAIFIAPQNGTYAVTVFNNECEATSACITINEVGLDETTVPNINIAISPNPVTDEFTVQFDSERIDLIVTDIQGKIVLRASGVVSGNKLSLAGADQGVYLLRLYSDQGTGMKRIVKQ